MIQARGQLKGIGIPRILKIFCFSVRLRDCLPTCQTCLEYFKHTVKSESCGAKHCIKKVVVLRSLERYVMRNHQCGCGETGNRSRFRSCRRKAWGFESLHPYQQKLTKNINNNREYANDNNIFLDHSWSICGLEFATAMVGKTSSKICPAKIHKNFKIEQ